MSKADRMQGRNQRSIANRSRFLGYYYIVTDTKETEKNYINGLRDSLPEELWDKVKVEVCNVQTENLLQKCDEIAENNLDPNIGKIWIVFDRDQVKNFDEIIRTARKRNYEVGWSNPCIEIWFHAYFGEMPSCINSSVCLKNFKEKYKNKTNEEYNKSEKNIYGILIQHGDESSAIKLARSRLQSLMDGTREMKPSEMNSASTLFELVKDIRRYTTHQDNMLG